MTRRALATVLVGCLATPQFACGNSDTRTEELPDSLAAIEQALPDAPIVPPKEARSLLVFDLAKGFAHASIPWVDFAVTRMGERTGAFTAVVTADTTMFESEHLAQFDGVLFNNTTGELFADSALRASLLAFVRSGKGLIGLHAATDGFYEWPEFGRMMGAYFVNHPWNEEVTVRIEEPGHPVTAAFEGPTYAVADEIYQFREPYSRDRLRVLMSLDPTALDLQRDGVLRDDADFAVSWVRREGAGRVFYSSLGHRYEIFTDPVILRHWLAGIQYALGDLEAEDTPRAR
jgi:type 1 glutamine amidotransferase